MGLPGTKYVNNKLNNPFIARIELDPDDILEIMESRIRKKIVERLKTIGFDHIVVDMEGYRSGSMDGRKN
ncbi:MAG: hypothetical protein H8E13_22025 [Actinobacteria bacterium]|nr:hypothetical protein [Actinomycetota bacterium]